MRPSRNKAGYGALFNGIGCRGETFSTESYSGGILKPFNISPIAVQTAAQARFLWECLRAAQKRDPTLISVERVGDDLVFKAKSEAEPKA